MSGSEWTFWLNVANYVMGLLTLLSLLAVLGALGWELIDRQWHRVHKVSSMVGHTR